METICSSMYESLSWRHLFHLVWFNPPWFAEEMKSMILIVDFFCPQLVKYPFVSLAKFE
jgi:hypothetical protein